MKYDKIVPVVLSLWVVVGFVVVIYETILRQPGNHFDASYPTSIFGGKK